jgi:hypothetical protein
MFALPFEADAILIIDPNAILASPVTSQALKPIARWHGQISQPTHPINLIELPPGYGPERAWAHPACSRLIDSFENRLGARILEGPYHASHYIG